MRETYESAESLYESVLEWSQVITEQERLISDFRRELKPLHTTIEGIRANVEYDIALDKAGYPNAEARKAGVSLVLYERADYRVTQQRVDALLGDIDVATVSRDDASRTRQNALAMLAFLTSYNTVNQPYPGRSAADR